MEKPYILHMLTTAKNLSPFDVNMAVDAGWISAIPYTNVEPSETKGLVQDVIFSRSPKGLQKTGIFIGGRDSKQAMDMLNTAKNAMLPSFEVSIFADPSGAFTTAASMVAVVIKELQEKFNTTLAGKSLLVLGGTGPVGQVASVLAAQSGAKVKIIGRQLEKAQRIAQLCNAEFGAGKIAIEAATNDAITTLIKTAEVIFSTGAAGVELLNDAHIAAATQLKVVADVNAVPPSAVAGLEPFAKGTQFSNSPSGAVGVGALAIGNIKYQTQSRLLKKMIASEQPLQLHFEHALAAATELIKLEKSAT